MNENKEDFQTLHGGRGHLSRPEARGRQWDRGTAGTESGGSFPFIPENDLGGKFLSFIHYYLNENLALFQNESLDMINP